METRIAMSLCFSITIRIRVATMLRAATITMRPMVMAIAVFSSQSAEKRLWFISIQSVVTIALAQTGHDRGRGLLDREHVDHPRLDEARAIPHVEDALGDAQRAGRPRRSRTRRGPLRTVPATLSFVIRGRTPIGREASLRRGHGTRRRPAPTSRRAARSRPRRIGGSAAAGAELEGVEAALLHLRCEPGHGPLLGGHDPLRVTAAAPPVGAGEDALAVGHGRRPEDARHLAERSRDRAIVLDRLVAGAEHAHVRGRAEDLRPDLATGARS